MEKCPKCQQISLIYDPYMHVAKCLRLKCGYRETMDSAEYSSKFEEEDRNMVHKLSFPINGKVATH